MGRIKNMIISKQREYEDDLDTLRKQLLDKESEFLNFELQQHLGLIWENINEIKRRLDQLDNNGVKKNIFKKAGSSELFYVLAAIAAIVGMYNKYKN